MSIVTLNKFLLKAQAGVNPSSPNPDAPPDHYPQQYLDVACRTIVALRHSVFSGEMFADLSEQMETIRKDLNVETAPELISGCAVRVEDALALYQDRRRQVEQERAAEFKYVLEVLNEVLSHLTLDSQQTAAQRHQLESNLALATRIDNIANLRVHLSKVLHSVREEGRQHHDKAQRVITNLGQQMQQVYRAEARFTSHLPGRTGALEFLTRIWPTSTPCSNLHLAVFVCDSLPAIRERHGDEVANLIMNDLGRKQLHPLAPEGNVFAWSPNALLLVWHQQDQSTAASQISFRLKQPYEHRAFVGTRVAVFNITLRSLVAQARDKLDDLVETLDDFCKRGVR